MVHLYKKSLVRTSFQKDIWTTEYHLERRFKQLKRVLVNEDFLSQPFYQQKEVTLLSTILKIEEKKISVLHCTNQLGVNNRET